MTLWQNLSSFPTAVPTTLLGVLMVYWLLTIIGIVDLGESLDIDLDVDGGHTDEAGLDTLAGYLVAMGLGGVPLSIVATLLVFFTWLGTVLLHRYVIAAIPTDTLQTLAGVGALLFTAVLSIPLSARLLKPMRGMFVKHSARSNRSLVGLQCKILTQRVDEGFGRAEVSDHGANLNIRVWAQAPNKLTRNSEAIIIDYDDAKQQYEVQAAPSSFN